MEKYQEQKNKNNKWLNKNESKLIEKYSDKIGQYVLINNETIIDFFEVIEEALLEGNLIFDEEPFSIHQFKPFNIEAL